jgi:hypothetical protein
LLASLITNTNGDVYQWVQSFAGTTINAQTGVIAGGCIAIQNGTIGGNNGSYIQFAFSMNNLTGLDISYATQRTNTGFTSQTWSWSTDGSTFNDIVTVSSIPTAFALQTVSTSAVNGASNAYLRVTFAGGSIASGAYAGNNRLDNITFSANPIPEPATMILLGFGGLLFARKK